MLRSQTLMLAAAAAALLGLSVAQAADDPNIDPKAAAALQKMGTYLRSLSAYQVRAALTDEDVLEDGQKIQYSGQAEVLASSPNRLWARISNDRKERVLFYDGKTLSVYAPRSGYYASIGAPATIAQLAKTLDEQYDISVPLEDLFLWGSAGFSTGGIESLMDVGPSEVDGTTCEQFAVRQKDIDWQIWVQLGAYPLPRRIVISNRTDEERPQHTAVYTWNLAPSFNEATFAFTPPPGTKRIPLARASLLAGTAGGSAATSNAANPGNGTNAGNAASPKQ